MGFVTKKGKAKMANIKYIFIVFIGAASYGILSTFVKIGYSYGFHVGEITGSQMFIGMTCLWLIAILAGRKKGQKLKQLQPRKLLTLLGVGSLTGLTGILYYSALSFIPASLAIVLLFQFTWIGILIEWIFGKQKPSKKTWIALGIIFVGTLLSANVFSNSGAHWPLTGLLLGLGAACSFAFFIFASGRVETQISPWNRSALMITGAVLLTFVIFPPTFFVSSAWGEGLWWIALILALFGAGLAQPNPQK